VVSTINHFSLPGLMLTTPHQDLRNHGESPHEDRHDYTAMAADVADFIRQHGLKESTLIGHSM